MRNVRNNSRIKDEILSEVNNQVEDVLLRYDKSWHLDKKIPIAFLLAILIQTFSSIWWAATVENRLSNIEKAVVQKEWAAKMENKISTVELEINRLRQEGATLKDVSSLATILDNKTANTEKTILNIEHKLDTLSHKFDYLLYYNRPSFRVQPPFPEVPPSGSLPQKEVISSQDGHK